MKQSKSWLFFLFFRKKGCSQQPLPLSSSLSTSSISSATSVSNSPSSFSSAHSSTSTASSSTDSATISSSTSNPTCDRISTLSPVYFSTSRLWRGVGLAYMAAFMWALLSLALKESLTFAQPETLSWFRLFSSSLILGGILAFKKNTQLWKEIKTIISSPLIILASLGLAFNYVGYAFSLDLTNPSNAQMLIQMGPFFTILFTFILGQEKTHALHLLGLFFAIVGFSIFYSDQMNFFITQIQSYHQGFLWILAASVSWAIWAIIQRNQTRQHPQMAWTINFLVWTLCSLILWPFADVTELFKINTKYHIFLLLFLAANTLIAYGSYTLAYLYAPTTIINLIISTNPILVFLISLESVGPLSWLGGALVTLGLGITLSPELKQSFQNIKLNRP